MYHCIYKKYGILLLVYEEKQDYRGTHPDCKLLAAAIKKREIIVCTEYSISCQKKNKLLSENGGAGITKKYDVRTKDRGPPQEEKTGSARQIYGSILLQTV